MLIILDQSGTKLDSLLTPFQTQSFINADLDVSSVTETNDGFIVAGTTTNLHDIAFPARATEALFEQCQLNWARILGCPGAY